MMNALSWVVTAIVALATSWAVGGETPASAIRRADRQFCQAVADRDGPRFLSFVAETATFGGGTGAEVRGRAAVQQAWAPFFRADGPTLTWEPAQAEVLSGGEVGYTSGRWTRTSKTAAGGATVAHGDYLTVWRKQADGVWRVVYDTGSDDPDPGRH